MIVKIDYKKFQKTLNERYPGNNYTEAEAAEAFHNLADCVLHLMEVSERLEREKKSEKK